LDGDNQYNDAGVRAGYSQGQGGAQQGYTVASTPVTSASAESAVPATAPAFGLAERGHGHGYGHGRGGHARGHMHAHGRGGRVLGLVEAVRYARTHDKQMRLISDAATDFATAHLSVESVRCYWSKLLHEYASLMCY
jgi:hypothetical protein